MSKQNGIDHSLPSRDICYAYAAAMYLGQQLEVNLRAILYAADHHGWGTDIEFDKSQSKRFKDTQGFIDRAPCGLIIEKLRAKGIISDRRAWRTFERACEHRNKLAHSFLAEQDFDTMTAQHASALIQKLHMMTVDLYGALLVSRSVRHLADTQSDNQHRRIQEFMREAGMADYENPDRKYETRRRRGKKH